MLKKLLLVLPLLVLTGCHHTYLDNNPPSVSYSEIAPRANPIPVILETKFTTNGGGENVSFSNMLNDQARTVLNNSKVFVVADNNPNAAKLVIHIDDQGSIAGAVAKGAVTGFTLGLIGNQVEDRFLMDATLTMPGRAPLTKQYMQTMYSTSGLIGGGAPDNATRIDLGGVDDAMRKLLLIYVKDVSQAAGYNIK